MILAGVYHTGGIGWLPRRVNRRALSPRRLSMELKEEPDCRCIFNYPAGSSKIYYLIRTILALFEVVPGHQSG
jgi:hypothetical protein